MIGSIAIAEEFPIEPVPAGYFVSEQLKAKIVELYPELEQIFQNAMKVGSGSYMTDNTTIELGNRINILKADKDKWKVKFETAMESREEENQTDDKINELLKIQIEDYKKQHQREQLQNTIEKTGLFVILGLLATNQ